jgi:UDP-N-acetyl-D-mannosaminuronate dehydrogenase
MDGNIVVVGLGYVGLPAAVALAERLASMVIVNAPLDLVY